MSECGDPVPILAVVGATAAGKTGLSLDLAAAWRGEVVNTDAMQVYVGMDVGTAKLPVTERRGIRHHLLDMLSVRETATVAEFQGWARTVITDLRAAGTGAGAGRRLGAVHPRGAGPLRVPRHRRDGPGPARGRAGDGRPGCPAHPTGGGGPRGGGEDPARQRSTGGPCAGGRGDHRQAVLGVAAQVGVRRRAHGPDRRRHRPGDPGPADRAAGRRPCSPAGWSRR